MSTIPKKPLTEEEADWVKTGIAPFNERAESRREDLSKRIKSYHVRYVKNKKLSDNELHELQGLYVDFINAPQSKLEYDGHVNAVMRDVFGSSWEPQGVQGNVKLFDSVGNPQEFRKFKLKRTPKAFNENAKFNKLIRVAAEEGPAFSKAAFMMGTFAETAYAGWLAGKPESVTAIAGILGEAGLSMPSAQGHVWLISIIVWGMGLMYESAFGFSWYRTGSNKLAGKQVELNEKLFNDCLHIMSGGLIAALASTLFSMQMVLNGWLVFQVVCTIHILKLQRQIKVSHPTYEARQEQTDAEAKWAAEWIREGGREQNLYLEKTAHARSIERKKLAISHAEDLKVIESKQFRTQQKREAINRHMAPDRDEQEAENVLGKFKNLLPWRSN